MDSDNEEDFPTAELKDPVWSEKPVCNRHWLCIDPIPCSSITGNTPRPPTPQPQPIQEEVPPETELMDVSVPDDLPNIIDI